LPWEIVGDLRGDVGMHSILVEKYAEK
jgi:hypothetical protein